MVPTGAFLGLGHGIGVAIVGGVGLVLRGFVDLKAWSAWAEFVVEFLLIGIGSWATISSRRIEVHGHKHEHTDTVHEHPHVHDPGRLEVNVESPTDLVGEGLDASSLPLLGPTEPVAVERGWFPSQVREW